MRANLTVIITLILLFSASPLLAAGPQEGVDIRASDPAIEGLTGACEASTGITIVDAWVRPSIVPGRPAAGYLTICNGGDHDDRLVSVESEDTASIEIHETRAENGVMNMRRLDGVSIPAGGMQDLLPGAKHLMIFGLSADVDSELLMRLSFERAGIVEVRAPLRSAPQGPHHH